MTKGLGKKLFQTKSLVVLVGCLVLLCGLATADPLPTFVPDNDWGSSFGGSANALGNGIAQDPDSQRSPQAINQLMGAALNKQEKILEPLLNEVIRLEGLTDESGEFRLLNSKPIFEGELALDGADNRVDGRIGSGTNQERRIKDIDTSAADTLLKELKNLSEDKTLPFANQDTIKNVLMKPLQDAFEKAEAANLKLAEQRGREKDEIAQRPPGNQNAGGGPGQGAGQGQSPGGGGSGGGGNDGGGGSKHKSLEPGEFQSPTFVQSTLPEGAGQIPTTADPPTSPEKVAGVDPLFDPSSVGQIGQDSGNRQLPIQGTARVGYQPRAGYPPPGAGRGTPGGVRTVASAGGSAGSAKGPINFSLVGKAARGELSPNALRLLGLTPEMAQAMLAGTIYAQNARVGERTEFRTVAPEWLASLENAHGVIRGSTRRNKQVGDGVSTVRRSIAGKRAIQRGSRSAAPRSGSGVKSGHKQPSR